ncbi:hypothetical protein D3C81_645100 [compost metagenome]
MVVVVQLFAADPERPGRQVGRGVCRFKIAVTPPMAEAVDHSRRPERNPRHLDRPQGDARQAEQHGVDREQQHRPEVGVRGVDMALDPILRRAAPVLFDIGTLRACFAVQLHAAPEHLADALGDRAVRVVLGFHLGVVLAMDGHPFAGDHRGGQPHPEAEEMRDQRMEIHAAMRLAAVQVQGHREDGELGEHQQHRQHAPPAQAGNTTSEEREQRIGHCRTPGRSVPDETSATHDGACRCKLHPPAARPLVESSAAFHIETHT